MARVLVEMEVWVEEINEDDPEVVEEIVRTIINDGADSTASSVTIHSVEVQ